MEEKLNNTTSVQNGSVLGLWVKSASNGGKPVIHEPLKYFPMPSKKE